MSILTKLHVNQEELNILYYRLSVSQDADYTGRPSAKPVVQPIEFTYETIKKDPFYEKMINGKMSDTLKLVLSPIQRNSKTTTIKLLDYYVLQHRDNFDGVNNKPMTTYVKISFASLIVNGQVMDTKYWKQSDPNHKEVTPTQINSNEDEEILTSHFEDTKGNKIDSPKIGTEVYLIIKTKNATGKSLDIDLSDKEKDFIYKGQILENDILENLIIKSDTQKEKLTVIAQN